MADQTGRIKHRVSMTLSADLLRRLNEDAEKVGMSVSTYANFILLNYYRSLDTVETINGFGKALANMTTAQRQQMMIDGTEVK